jgi:hypothetical protein
VAPPLRLCLVRADIPPVKVQWERPEQPRT